MKKLSEMDVKEQIVYTMTRIYERGMTTMTGGNISVKDKNGDIWITPKGFDKGNLKPIDIVCVHSDGKFEGIHEPSSELPFHRAIFNARPDLGCVIHAHPNALVAFSISHELPQTALTTHSERRIGKVVYSQYAFPGTEELGQSIASAFRTGANLVMLQNHGICVGGDNLSEAFLKFEQIELLARMQISASRLKKPVVLNEAELQLGELILGNDPDLAAWKKDPSIVEKGKDLIRFINRAYDHKLLSVGFGVASIRISADEFLVTPEEGDLSELVPDDLVMVKMDSVEKDKKVDGLVNLHTAIYFEHPEINVIFCFQPIAAMAFILSRVEIDFRTIPETVVVLMKLVKISNSAAYEDTAIAAKLIGKLSPVGLIENNCVLVTGKSLLQTYDRLEVLESSAQSCLDSTVIGGLHPIDGENYDKLFALAVKIANSN
jgi:L-fuculose-phosphate aldolase